MGGQQKRALVAPTHGPCMKRPKLNEDECNTTRALLRRPAGFPASVPMDLNMFVSRMCDAWFDTPAAFQNEIATRPLRCDPFPDSIQIRCICVANRLGLLKSFNKCPCCSSSVRLVYELSKDRADGVRFRWECKSWRRHKCWSSGVGADSFFGSVAYQSMVTILPLGRLPEERLPYG